VAGWREARSLAKSNKLDADLLAELWDHKPSVHGGVLRRWWEVWLAPQEVRDQRERLRHRMSLVRVQTGLKNRIHALLHRHGIVAEFADLFGVAGRRFLSLLVEDPKRLRETARRSLKDQLILLDALRRLIARATGQFRQSIKTNEPARRLTSLPGVSVILAYTMAAEIGRIERFKSSRHLLSYALLAPKADDSGQDREGKPIGRRIGHAGRATLQWAFIEAAHGAVRKDERFRAIFDRRTDHGQQDRGRGYITVAHALCKTAYAMWKKGIDYQEVPPIRPGSKRQETEIESMDLSRSGTGQPLDPMARCLHVEAQEATL